MAKMSGFLRDHQVLTSVRVKLASFAKVVMDIARTDEVRVGAIIESGSRPLIRVELDGVLVSRLAADATTIAAMRKDVDDFIIREVGSPQVTILKLLDKAAIIQTG